MLPPLRGSSFGLVFWCLFLLTPTTTTAQTPDNPNAPTKPEFQVINDAPYQVIPGLPALSSKGESLKTLGFESPKELLDKVDQATEVSSVAISPNGRFIASGSLDNTVRLWDIERRTLVHALKSHKSYINSVAFSPNSRFIASGSWDGTVRLWDLEKQTLVNTFNGHKMPVLSVAFSPSGRFVASGSWDKTVRLWDLEKQTLVNTFEGHNMPIRTVAFSPNGRFIASGSVDKSVRLWDVNKQTMVHAFVGHEENILSVSFCPNNRFIASGASDNTVRLWDVEKQTMVHAFVGHEAPVESVAFSPNGRLIVSGSVDNTVRLWDVKTHAMVHAFKYHEASVESVAFSPDGRFVVSGSWDKTVRLWDVEKKRELQIFLGGADGNWLTVDHEKQVHRGEDGTWIRQLRQNMHGPVHPPLMAKADNFSLKVVIDTKPIQPENSRKIEIKVKNIGKAPAYWLHLEPVATDDTYVTWYSPDNWIESGKKGKQSWKPQRISKLESGETASIFAQITIRHHWEVRFLESRKRTVKFTVASANGTAVTESFVIDVHYPSLTWSTADLNKDDNTLKALLNNNGKAPLNPSTVALHVNSKDNDPISKSTQSLPFMKPGGTHEIAFVLPEELHDKLEDLVLIGETDNFPRFQWELKPEKVILHVAWLPWIISGFLLTGLAIGVFFFRRYGHPLVVKLSEQPKTILQLPMEELPDARKRLLKTDRLETVLSRADVSKQSLNESIDFVEILGAVEKVSLIAKRLTATVTSINKQLFELILPEQFPLNLQRCFVYVPSPKVSAEDVIATLKQTPKIRMHPTIIIGKDSAFQLALRKTTKDRTNKYVAPLGSELTNLLLGQNPEIVLSKILAEQISLKQLSPYQVGAGVNREAVFFGRQELISDIINRDPANYLLVGGRQLGKSSLLKALQRRYAEYPDICCHYIALSNEVLVPRIAKELELSADTDLSAIAECMAEAKCRHIFLIDEADKFIGDERHNGYEILGSLRRISEEGHAHFILAGFWTLYQHASLDYQSPLKNFGQLVNIGALEKDACYQLAKDPMRSMRLSYANKELVKQIVDTTGQRANLIAIVCNEILKLLKPEQRLIEAADVATALESDLLRRALKGWDSLCDDSAACAIDREVVFATIKEERFTLPQLKNKLKDKHEKQLEHALERLDLAFVIGREKNEYTYRVPMFVEMVREST